MDEISSLMLRRIQEVEARDESQILAELAGETVKEYVYEIFNKQGKRIGAKLSWIGTKELARQQGNIAVSEGSISDGDGYIRVVVKATDLARNFTVFGGCHQPYKQKVKIEDESGKVKGYEEQDDPYYFTKALSKAQRNAIQAVMPTTILTKFVNRFLAMSGKEPVKAITQRTKPIPKLAKDMLEPTQEQIQTLHDLELAAWNRWKIQPARLYKELGYNTKADVTESPYECFLRLKAVLDIGETDSTTPLA